MDTETVETVFTVAEVAKALKLNVRTVYLALKAGTLKGTRLGRSWRIRSAEVQAYLKRHTTR